MTRTVSIKYPEPSDPNYKWFGELFDSDDPTEAWNQCSRGDWLIAYAIHKGWHKSLRRSVMRAATSLFWFSARELEILKIACGAEPAVLTAERIKLRHTHVIERILHSLLNPDIIYATLAGANAVCDAYRATATDPNFGRIAYNKAQKQIADSVRAGVSHDLARR